MFHLVFCILLIVRYVSCGGSVTSVGEERASSSAIIYLWLCGFFSERFPLPLCAGGGLCYFIVSLPELSISLLSIYMNINDKFRN